MAQPWKPTKQQLQDAYGTEIPDLIAHGLDVLFCGINPSLYSGAVGHHFARPGNRFWPALHRSGFTPTQLSPFDEEELLALGLGITNIVARSTARADELEDEEIVAGGALLRDKVVRYRPRFLAPLGITAYRLICGRRDAKVGLQPETIGDTKVWLLPNPSGLNAHYTADELAAEFRHLRDELAKVATGLGPRRAVDRARPNEASPQTGLGPRRASRPGEAERGLPPDGVGAPSSQSTQQE